MSNDPLASALRIEVIQNPGNRQLYCVALCDGQCVSGFPKGREFLVTLGGCLSVTQTRAARAGPKMALGPFGGAL